MNLSYTFLELGEHNIRSDNSWFAPVIVRHCKLNDIRGTWGHALQVSQAAPVGPFGLATAGVTVTLSGVEVLIFTSLGFRIADLVGHQEGLDWKGANGYRPYLRHMNVFKKNSETVEEDPTAGFVEITCVDPARFKAQKATDIHQAADNLADAHGRVQA